MADLTGNAVTPHRAVAEAEVAMAQETLSAIVDGAVGKGDVLSVAELAGVMAGKRAADLIPLVHPAGLTELVVNASPDRAGSAVRIRCETAALGQAGVEMEAMVAASVAALTVYDMVRDIEPGVTVRSLMLISSSGGDSDEWRRPDEPHEGARPPKGARVAGRIGPGPRAGGNFRPAPGKRTP